MSLTVYRADGTPKAGDVAVSSEPVGAIMAYAGGAVASDWMICDGRAVSRAAYPELLAAIGTAWGVGDGSTTFNIPDLRGATIVGAGQGSGLTLRTLAGKGGEEKHTLVIAEMPAHSHNANTGAYAPPAGGSGFVQRYAAPAYDGYLANTGGDGPHENMPPFAVANWIIRVLSPARIGGLIAPPIPLVSSLPANPVDGQEVHYLADATNGVIWHLRYRAGSASAYKWEFVGGPALHGQYDADEQTTGSVYNLSAPGVTVPLAGDYDIEHGCRGGWTAGGTGQMSYAIGATAAVDADAVAFATPAGVAAHFQRARRKTGLAAGTFLQTAYKNQSGTPSFGARWIRATPVRVG